MFDGVGCLDDAALYELIHGRLAGGSLAEVDAHLDGCDTCRELVIAAARGSDGRHAPAADELRAGDTVDRYLVLGRLGGGAMGVVYAAHDAELDRKVALKLLRPEFAADAASPSRIVREAQAMARLQHQNVVTVHDVGAVGDRVFVAMELVAGPTLRVWAVGKAWRERLACLVAVGRGLAAAHAAGIVHRDVKPDNVIVDEHDRPRIGDFGLARAGEGSRAAPPASAQATTLTQTGTVLGTPMYMAPEQLRGEPATPASDQFGFAVTAWEVMFGARPFAGDDLTALAAAIARGPAAPQRDGVPASVERALRRALAVEPAARWPTVGALVEAIDWKPSRRWLWAVPAATAGAAAIAIALAPPIERPIDPCRDAAAALDEAWSPAIAAEVRGKLAAAHDLTSADRIGEWAATWRDARLGVCRAGRVRGAESEALLDVRGACLDRGRAELAALAGELRAAEPATLTSVAAAVAALTDPRECATSSALALLSPVPFAQRDAVRAVEERAAALRARLATSQPIDPADGAALVAAAGATGHSPTLAAAHVAHAELLRRAGDATAADRAARAAVVAAEIGHDDLGAARAWITRVGAAGERRDLAAADEWLLLAAAAVTRAGDPPALAARLAHATGMLAMNRGAFADAERELTRALARRRELAGDRPDIDVASTLSSLGHVARLRGDLEAALALFRESLAMHEALLDAEHPDVARELHNTAGALRLLDRLDEAEAHYRRSLALRLAALGPDHPDVGLSHNSLGLLALRRGDHAAADAALVEARRILAATGHGELPIAIANLGLLRLQQGRPGEALVLLEDAIARYRATLPARHERIARAFLDAASAAAALRDLPRARSLLASARAAIPAEAGDRFVAEADALAATLGPKPQPKPKPSPVAETETVAPKPKPKPVPVKLPKDIPTGTYGSGQSWN